MQQAYCIATWNFCRPVICTEPNVLVATSSIPVFARRRDRVPFLNFISSPRGAVRAAPQFRIDLRQFSHRSRMTRDLAAGRFRRRCVLKPICLHGSPIAAVWRADNAPWRFRAKACPGLDPGWIPVRTTVKLCADCVGLSAVEDASKLQSGASF